MAAASASRRLATMDQEGHAVLNAALGGVDGGLAEAGAEGFPHRVVALIGPE